MLKIIGIVVLVIVAIGALLFFAGDDILDNFF